MLIRMSAALMLLAGAAGNDNMEIYGWSHEVVSPRAAAAAGDLDSALQRFERDLAGKRGGSRARSSKPKEIVVVGSKIKESGRPPSGGFKSVSGLDSETDVVEFREGGPASLTQLRAAIGRFERAAGPKSPCVRRCRAQERRCLARCRRALGARRMTGRCVCDHERARCLVRAVKQGKCTPPDPVRPRRR